MTIYTLHHSTSSIATRANNRVRNTLSTRSMPV
jgi:hypothetical protein